MNNPLPTPLEFERYPSPDIRLAAVEWFKFESIEVNIMQERRDPEFERRIAERRKHEQDVRVETEKGILGERRSGDDRRGGCDRRAQQVVY
ncbi:MAG: hypothetical protein AAGA53_17510 [Pseudomonadota bacterium]